MLRQLSGTRRQPHYALTGTAPALGDDLVDPDSLDLAPKIASIAADALLALSP